MKIYFLLITVFILLSPNVYAQFEIKTNEGKKIQGKIVSVTEETIVVSVYSQTRKESTNVIMKKNDILQIFDLIEDKDVTKDYLQKDTQQIQNKETEPESNNQTDELKSLPKRLKEEANKPNTLDPRNKTTENSFNTMLDFGVTTQYYHQLSGDGTFHYTPDFSLSYYFNKLSHDNEHRTGASKRVIPSSFLTMNIELGPYYSNSPGQFALRLNGAGLVSDMVAIGGGIIYHTINVEASAYQSGYTVTDLGFFH